MPQKGLPTVTAIIVAAGASRRMGFDKLSYCLPDGRTVLETSCALFVAHPAVDELVLVARPGGKYARTESVTPETLCRIPLVLRENGSGTLDVVEAALAEHQVKLSQLNVVLQMGSTESIKLFLENSEVLGIVSIRAVTRELMSGRLKVIEVEGFRAERMFTFAEPQGQNGGVEESFIRYACQNWR